MLFGHVQDVVVLPYRSWLWSRRAENGWPNGSWHVHGTAQTTVEERDGTNAERKIEHVRFGMISIVVNGRYYVYVEDILMGHGF